MQRRAELFAGIHYVMPEWQRDFEYPNDFTQDEAFALIPGMLDDYADVIELECAWIRRWFPSDSRTYHVFKVLNALDGPAARAAGNG
jgi:hypothetical protein